MSEDARLLDNLHRGTRDLGAGLSAHLATLDTDRWEPFLLDLIRVHAAAVLGHSDARSVGVGADFIDLGLDPRGAVELRERLSIATGLPLPTTLLVDYPRPWPLARFLLGELVPPVTPQHQDFPYAGTEPWSPVAITGPVPHPEVVHIYGPDDLDLIGAGCAPPAIVAVVEPATAGATPLRGRQNLAAACRLVEGWLARPELVDSRLVLVTHRAVSVDAHDHVDLAVAPVGELVRTAQAQHPGRIVLLDTDTPPDQDIPGPLLARALACGEPELAIRGAGLLAPARRPVAAGSRR
jgi:hypothetical protein